MCPFMAGGRSRRGSPKAGTTVLAEFYICNTKVPKAKAGLSVFCATWLRFRHLLCYVQETVVS